MPNGSFETYTQCPTVSSQIYYAPPWTGPTSNSSDYLNACSNIANVPYYGGINAPYPFYLDAKTGNAYAGLQVYNVDNYREYAQVELIDTLEYEGCYYLEFYVANIQRAVFGINNIAANLSSISYPSNLAHPGLIPIVTNTITNYNNPIIKDTVRWQKISGLCKGTGVEKFMIIGNFNSHTTTDTSRIYQLGHGPFELAFYAYIFVDAVSVFSINPSGKLPWSYRDTSIIKGDSVYIGNKMGGKNFNPKWFTMSGNYLATNAGITVRPLVTTSYVVQYTVCGTARADTVEVKVWDDVGINELHPSSRSGADYRLKIYPNPVNDILNIEIEDSRLKVQDWQIEIVNNLGQILREEEVNFKDKKASISTVDLEQGIYFLRLSNKEGLSVNRKFVVGE